MRLTYSPEALPGSCFVCGNASRESYIDTGVSLEFHGAVYLCNLCLAEAAHLLGFATPDEVTALKNTVSTLETKQYELRRQLDGLEMAINGFTLARGTGGADSISDVDLVASSADDRTSQSSGDVGDGASESTESLHDQGVAELSNDGESSEFTLNL